MHFRHSCSQTPEKSEKSLARIRFQTPGVNASWS